MALDWARTLACEGTLAHGLREHHGVSLPELKMSTNFKMHLKPSVQNVWQNLDSGNLKYTVVHLESLDVYLDLNRRYVQVCP